MPRPRNAKSSTALGSFSGDGFDPGSPNLVRGVDQNNYATLARPFFEAGKNFLIAREAGESIKERMEWPATPRQWGAWLSYFLRKRINAKGMGERSYYTVPAEWPHLFDADETVQGDHLAGEAFERLYVPGQRTGFFQPDDKLGFRKKLR